MPDHNYAPGLGSVGSYQMSAIPFLTASIEIPNTTPIEIEFPNVTKFVKVLNTSTASLDIHVGFSARGINTENNYFVLANGESYEADWRVASIFIASATDTTTTVDIVAGLTTIKSSNNLPENWSGSVGVG